MRKLSSIFFLCLISSCATAQSYEREAVTLPVAESHTITLETREGERDLSGQAEGPTGIFATLLISMRMDSDSPTGYYLPADLSDAFAELRHMLPPDYFDFLIHRFGFASTQKEAETPRNLHYDFDDRIMDFEQYLHFAWNLDDKSTQFARQVACLGHSEFDLVPFFVLLAMDERSNRDAHWRLDMEEAFILAERLRFLCTGR